LWDELVALPDNVGGWPPDSSLSWRLRYTPDTSSLFCGDCDSG
jgi:hypothetical protein